MEGQCIHTPLLELADGDGGTIELILYSRDRGGDLPARLGIDRVPPYARPGVWQRILLFHKTL